MSKPKNMTPEQEAAWRESQKAYKAAYRKANADKIRQYNAEYRAANPEKAKTWAATYQEKHADEIRARQAIKNQERGDYAKRYAQKNAAKLSAYKKAWASQNPEKIKRTLSAYYNSNKDKFKINVHNRRARIKGGGGRFSHGLADRLLTLQRGKCACCKTDLGASGFHIDHHMPIALGGSNTDDNAQLLCPTCNLSKHAKHPVDFMQQRGYLL